MFFAKESTAYAPSIHEMRMGQLFPSSDYKNNYKKTKKRNDTYDFSFLGVQNTKTIKRKSFLEESVEFVYNFDLRKISLFQMTPDIAHDYYLYKIKKEDKISISNFSFYEIDGSINCSRVFLGLFSENPYTKQKATQLLEEALREFVHSEAFIDYTSMIFACSVAAILFFSIFFNVSAFFEYYLNFLF